MDCIELCGGVHTAPTQQCHRVLLQFVGTRVVVGVSVGQYECAITRTGSNLFTSPDCQQAGSRRSTGTFWIVFTTHKVARRYWFQSCLFREGVPVQGPASPLSVEGPGRHVQTCSLWPWHTGRPRTSSNLITWWSTGGWHSTGMLSCFQERRCGVWRRWRSRCTPVQLVTTSSQVRSNVPWSSW